MDCYFDLTTLCMLYTAISNRSYCSIMVVVVAFVRGWYQRLQAVDPMDRLQL